MYFVVYSVGIWVGLPRDVYSYLGSHRRTGECEGGRWGLITKHPDPARTFPAEPPFHPALSSLTKCLTASAFTHYIHCYSVEFNCYTHCSNSSLQRSLTALTATTLILTWRWRISLQSPL